MSRFHLLRPVLLGAALVACTSAVATPARATAAASVTPAGATDSTITVILVRHAEKAATPGSDPELSAAGNARALALAAALRDAGITAAIVTPYKRTGMTAAPAAQARGLSPVAVPVAGGVDHPRAVAAEVRKHAGGVVLVVGHSNTVPAIIAALGGPRMADICDAHYANLFVMRIPTSGTPSLVRASYGAADAAAADTCPGMVPR